MQLEAAEEHLRASLASGAALMTRADAASSLGRCAIVSGGRSAEAAADAMASLAQELAPLHPERSLELCSELLMLATALPPLRPGVGTHLRRFRSQARGHPAFEAVAAIHSAHEQLLKGEPAAAAVEQVQAALATGLPAAAPNAAFLAVIALAFGERYELALRLLDVALDGARLEGASRPPHQHRRRRVLLAPTPGHAANRTTTGTGRPSLNAPRFTSRAAGPARGVGAPTGFDWHRSWSPVGLVYIHSGYTA